MADYFTEFSATLELPSSREVDYAMDLHTLFKEKAIKELPDVLKRHTDEELFEISRHGPDGNELWLHGTNCSLELVADFMQHVFKHFELNTVLMLQWGNYCSSPRTDGFGGGVMLITRHLVRMFTTHEWADIACLCGKDNWDGSFNMLRREMFLNDLNRLRDEYPECFVSAWTPDDFEVNWDDDRAEELVEWLRGNWKADVGVNWAVLEQAKAACQTDKEIQ